MISLSQIFRSKNKILIITGTVFKHPLERLISKKHQKDISNPFSPYLYICLRFSKSVLDIKSDINNLIMSDINSLSMA